MSNIEDRAVLTTRQAEIYAFLIEYYLENDQLPPTRTIQREFGWESQTAAIGHIRCLCRKGWLEKNAAGRFKFARPFSNNPPVASD